MQSNRRLHSIGSYTCSIGSYFHSIGSYFHHWIARFFHWIVLPFHWIVLSSQDRTFLPLDRTSIPLDRTLIIGSYLSSIGSYVHSIGSYFHHWIVPFFHWIVPFFHSIVLQLFCHQLYYNHYCRQFEEIFGCSYTRHSTFVSAPCIFNALGVGTCVWVDQVQAVVNSEMTTAHVFQAVASFPHVAQHACIPGNMWARMMVRTVSLSLCPTGEGKRLWSRGRCRQLQRPTFVRCSDRSCASFCKTWTRKQVDPTGRKN